MTREELFLWGMDNAWKYPVLHTLSEKNINGIPFLFLPGKYGVYKGLYLCFCENSAVYKLRGNRLCSRNYKKLQDSAETAFRVCKI
jgi:hypothetical protein